METRSAVELLSTLTIPLTIGALIIRAAWHNGDLGPITIQLAATDTFGPLILILALERITEGQTVVALVGPQCDSCFEATAVNKRGIRIKDPFGHLGP